MSLWLPFHYLENKDKFIITLPVASKQEMKEDFWEHATGWKFFLSQLSQK